MNGPVGKKVVRMLFKKKVEVSKEDILEMCSYKGSLGSLKIVWAHCKNKPRKIVGAQKSPFGLTETHVLGLIFFLFKNETATFLRFIGLNKNKLSCTPLE